MNLGRIYTLRALLEDEEISLGEISEIDEAYKALVDSGVELRDEPENALAKDMLDELEEHASTIEKAIYAHVKEHYGENEANDPSWDTLALADDINKTQIIMGAENGTIGALLGDK